MIYGTCWPQISDTDGYWISDGKIVARAVVDGKRAIAIADRDGVSRSGGDIYDACQASRFRAEPITTEAITAAILVRDACKTFGY